ncbi:hypothetical protein PILCRDRAFT_93316 [Piloderma croceum F 1598]|uniref:Uncharacterized protein n=1 Tax=Piloderma croceum (strain F 1598) TaxID=765440 RepID=A0A0C3AG66_PILCF|nr:hypothetical protein PILCRDRAFT_93316 [Piloderma croceum F 1598]
MERKSERRIRPFPTILSQVSQTAVRQEEKAKWKAEEGKLHVKRLEMDRAKYLYLLDQTVPLKCFVNTKITIIQRLCYTVRNVFMLQLRWILAAIGRTCLFGVREPTSPHLNPSFDRKDSVLSVYASLTLIPVITISRRCFGHADFIIFILIIFHLE